MASIKISDLRFANSAQSESYIRELSEGELGVQGGFWPVFVIATAILLLSSKAK